jgi:hypothetical protein
LRLWKPPRHQQLQQSEGFLTAVGTLLTDEIHRNYLVQQQQIGTIFMMKLRAMLPLFISVRYPTEKPKNQNINLPVILYGCETWSLTQRVKHKYTVFKNKHWEDTLT